jgi:hypothetical protein
LDRATEPQEFPAARRYEQERKLAEDIQMASDSISNRRGKKGRHQSKLEHDEGTLGNVRSSLSETAEEVSDYVSGGVEQIRDRVRETTRDREGRVVFVALAVGFGVGLALGMTLATPHRRSRSWRDHITTEGLGRRVKEGLESVVPERLAGCFNR